MENIFINYPIPAPSSRTSFPLIFGSIPMTSGCSSCVKVSALLSNIISSTLWAMECLFQNSVIWSRVWLDSTSVATENNMAFQVNGYSLGSLKTSFFETLQKVFYCKKQFSQGTNLRLFPWSAWLKKWAKIRFISPLFCPNNKNKNHNNILSDNKKTAYTSRLKTISLYWPALFRQLG